MATVVPSFLLVYTCWTQRLAILLFEASYTSRMLAIMVEYGVANSGGSIAVGEKSYDKMNIKHGVYR